jgi:hypothetical protein
LWIELELSGLDLRQIEHLVDEAEQVARLKLVPGVRVPP